MSNKTVKERCHEPHKNSSVNIHACSFTAASAFAALPDCYAELKAINGDGKGWRVAVSPDF